MSADLDPSRARSRRELSRKMNTAMLLFCYALPLSGDADTRPAVNWPPIESMAEDETVDDSVNDSGGSVGETVRAEDLDETRVERALYACTYGTPQTIGFPDLGVEAPVEFVGSAKLANGGEKVVEPKGRGADGGYNTIGVYEGSLKTEGQNLDNAPPFDLSAHSTRIEPSLFPREPLERYLETRKLAGKTIVITAAMASQEGAAKCSYLVAPEEMHNIKGKASAFSSVFTDVVSSLTAEDVVFSTCAGNPDVKSGTSTDAIILGGKLDSVELPDGEVVRIRRAA